MNKYKYLLITTFLSFILLPNITYADCTEEEIAHFKEIEDEYKITYEFNQETKSYTIKYKVPEPDMYDYISYIDEDADCRDLNENEFECYNIYPGEYDIEIVGQTETCGRIFKAITIKLAEYNNYSSDPLCKGIEEFVLCQPTYDKVITYEEFVSRVNVYKKTKANKKKEENKEKEIIKPILDYIEDNLFQIIVIIIFITIVIITIIITAKSIRKSRRLE